MINHLIYEVSNLICIHWEELVTGIIGVNCEFM